jgi:hypothetical protein
MRFQTIRATHRVVVDWVAETFHLPEDPARFHAEARARAITNARNLREAVHQNRHHGPRRARRLTGWQARIGRTLGAAETAAAATAPDEGEVRR